MTKKEPVIIYVDLFTLEGLYHFPHFVVLTKIDDEMATIHDSSSGKKIEIKTKILMRSISYVRNRLKVAPKLIRIK